MSRYAFCPRGAHSVDDGFRWGGELQPVEELIPFGHNRGEHCTWASSRSVSKMFEVA